jgi:integrase
LTSAPLPAASGPGRIEGVIRAKRPTRLPVVLSADEVSSVMAQLETPHRLIAQLQYGAGLRLIECPQLETVSKGV